MRLSLGWALLAGCVASAPRSPAASPPPPLLEINALVAGHAAAISLAAGLPAGSRVWFLVSDGPPGPGPCPRALGGACVGLTAPRVLATDTADGQGEARATFSVPAAPGRAATFQAVADTPTGLQLTGVLSSTVLDPQRDDDHDGSDNLEEVLQHTDPLRPDTDGGGTRDGQEVLRDRTDPRDPADDQAGERICGFDLVDDDGDGLADCADPDCVGPCTETAWECVSGWDDDFDGLVDCADPDCRCGDVEVCGDQVDNDGDRLMDCQDFDCHDQCVEDCANGADDDGDSVHDCSDPDCMPCVEDCANGVDDDGDGLADCDDWRCTCVEGCHDGLDQDGDRFVDCEDPDCACVEVCGNGLDEDADLRVDCADPDCACGERCEPGVDDDHDGLSACADPDCPCPEGCTDGIDGDADGLMDCEDADCTDLCTEICDNGQDDDADRWTDCQDEDCWPEARCGAEGVVAWVEGTHSVALSRLTQDLYNPDCDRRISSQDERAAATAVAGMVRVSHAGRIDLCPWRVDWMIHRRAHGHGPEGVVYSGYPGSCAPETFSRDDVIRDGFRVQAGCGLGGSSFLPQRLYVDLQTSTSPLGGARVLAAAARTSHGLPWYEVAIPEQTSVWDMRSPQHSGTFRLRESRGRAAMPAAAFGTCEVGLPALVPDPDARWGVGGTCLE